MAKKIKVFILIISSFFFFLNKNFAQNYIQSLNKYITKLKSSYENVCSENIYRLYTNSTYNISMGEYVKAYNDISQALKENPSISALHYKMAIILDKIPSYANKENGIFNSETHILIAIELENIPIYQITAIELYDKQGKIDEAISIYKKIKSSGKNLNDEELKHLAELYLKQKNFQEALSIYSKIKIVNYKIIEEKIQIYKKIGDFDNEILEYKKLVELFPNVERYVLEYLDLLLKINHFESVIDFIKKHIKIYPMHYRVLNLYIATLLSKKREREAEEVILNFLKKKNSEKYKAEIIEVYIENNGINELFISNVCNILISSSPEMRVFVENLNEIVKTKRTVL